MVRRHAGETRVGTIELAETGIPASPEPPELTKDLVKNRAEDLEKGTAFDWSDNSTWGELYDDRTLLVGQNERTWVDDVEKMLSQGGQPSSVEKALSLPIMMSSLSIEAPDDGKKEADFIRNVLFSSGNQAGMRPDLVQIVAQMTYAIAVKRTYHELVFTERDDGKIGYKSVSWRPPASCEQIRDRRSGRLRGFRQYADAETIGEMQRRGTRDVHMLGSDEAMDDVGYVRIPATRALMHIHGQHRDPINGISDLQVTHWAWNLQQKILLMWATFLDGQSQPKVIAYGSTKGDATANAAAIATLKGSGVLGMKRDSSNPDQKVFDILETSGKGAVEFKEMIRWLEQQMSHSVLAGFLDLTSNASEGIGSYALSADQKGLFLTSRQAAAKEIAATVTEQLISPLIRINFGSKAPIPRMIFEKMSEDQSEKAMQMLQQLGSANNVHVPEGFLDLLVERVATYLELSDEKVEKLLKEHAEKRKKMAEEMGRTPEESATFNGQVTDKVNAAQDIIKQHRMEKQ